MGKKVFSTFPKLREPAVASRRFGWTPRERERYILPFVRDVMGKKVYSTFPQWKTVASRRFDLTPWERYFLPFENVMSWEKRYILPFRNGNPTVASRRFGWTPRERERYFLPFENVTSWEKGIFYLSEMEILSDHKTTCESAE
jgi:hypothetical protein